MSAQQTLDFNQARHDGELWGRLIEFAVGAYLYNHLLPTMRLTYWREGQTEVDFVVEYGQQLLAIEVKSGRYKGVLIGLERFARHFDQYKVIPLIVGTGGISVELFLKTPLVDWF